MSWPFASSCLTAALNFGDDEQRQQAIEVAPDVELAALLGRQRQHEVRLDGRVLAISVLTSIAAAVERPVSGPFNLAADGVLGAHDLGALLEPAAKAWAWPIGKGKD